jgi:hypothetical protein
MCDLYVEVHLSTFLVLVVALLLMFHSYTSSLLLHISMSAHAGSQEVSCWLLTAEAWFQSQGHPYWTCGGQTGTGTSFSPSSSAFPCTLTFHQ